MSDRRMMLEQDIPVENNFDLLRLILALSVFCTHYDRIFGERMINFPITISTSVSAFFVISGFLIYRSCLRSSSLKSYWVKRAKRILPAYLLVVLLVPVLFFAYSGLPMSDYFLSWDMLKYYAANLTTLNFLHPGLPDVMEGKSVNPSLWTIKIELFLYFITPILIWMNVERRRWALLLALAIVSFVSVMLRRHADITGVAFYDLVGKWSSLVACFLTGVAFYLYREWMDRFKWYLLPPVVALLGVESYWVDFLRPFALGVVLYVVAFSLPCFKPLKRVGDLSYGIYLYHGPIVYFTICMGWTQSWSNFFITLSSVLLLSFLSWHLLEKRVLCRRK